MYKEREKRNIILMANIYIINAQATNDCFMLRNRAIYVI